MESIVGQIKLCTGVKTLATRNAFPAKHAHACQQNRVAENGSLFDDSKFSVLM